MKKKKENKKELDLNDWEILKNENEDEKKEEKKTIFDEFLSDADWYIKDETEYKNKILNETWLKQSIYLDINKFSENISSFHNFDNHCTILEKSKINILSSQNYQTTKKLIRKGISPKYMHDILLKTFNIEKVNESNYNKLYSMIFKEHDINNLDDYVPYFTGKKTLKESLPFHYLNEKGILELKILLWMINEVHRNVIMYCPILIRLISLFLIFCNKYETLELTCALIEKEKNKENEEIKRRLAFNRNDNKIIIDSIESCISEVSNIKRNKYYEILGKLKFNKRDIYQDMFNDFLFNYLNFYGIIRLLPLYLREGYKSIFRIICSIENEILEKEKDFKKTDNIILKIREKSKKYDVDKIFKNSFIYKFKINKIEENQEEITNENNEFYLPIYKGGDLLTDYEIIHLWELFPTEYKIKNASIIYQASKDGYNLPNITQLEEKYNKNTFILFLIGTSDGDKFGFVNSNLIIHTNNEYQRPNSTLLFTIKPEFKIYSPEVDSDEILYVSNKDFIFGNGPNGPAIQLNQDIRKGMSYKGGCFNNPCLVKDPDGHFVVTKLEIFKLE
jgi:hypothetical protein